MADGLCLPVLYDLPALPWSIPVTLYVTDDDERDMDSEYDSEKVLIAVIQNPLTVVVQPATMTTMIDKWLFIILFRIITMLDIRFVVNELYIRLRM